MNSRCQKKLTNIAVWLATEALLNLVGLDTLATYSELVFNSHRFTELAERLTVSELIHDETLLPIRIFDCSR